MRACRIEIPDSALDDPRERLARTRWPNPSTVDGWAQGVPLDYAHEAHELCDYWAHTYDWRRCEAELNGLPQFRTGLDGGGDDAVEVHLIHARSRHAGALPLPLTHGWPGSVVEPPRGPRPAGPARRVPRRRAVTARVRLQRQALGVGLGGRTDRDGVGEPMDRLGYDRHGAQGGDWGARVTSALGTGAPEHLVGIHLTMPLAARPPDGGEPPLTEAEQRAPADRKTFRKLGTGYSAEQSDCAGHPENVVPRDRLLDNVMLYWLPGTGASSARLYWESYHGPRLREVTVPTGVTLFPQEIIRLPRHWVQRRYTDLRYWSEPATGGHFASLEPPAVFVDEVRTFFRLVR